MQKLAIIVITSLLHIVATKAFSTTSSHSIRPRYSSPCSSESTPPSAIFRCPSANPCFYDRLMISKRFLSSSTTEKAMSITQEMTSTNTRTSLPFLKLDKPNVLEAVISTPASVFGRPLDQTTKDNNKKLVTTIKSFLFDVIFQEQDQKTNNGGVTATSSSKSLERSFARFYALETIARMPYFAYLSVLHLLETLGRWRQVEYLQIHFAESWNEMHHLKIMEELGGNSKWLDRVVAQHIAFFYYWIAVLLYLVNPTMAYNLNQVVEEEAYATYDHFLSSQRDELIQRPAPVIAIQYYTGTDMYLFDTMHTEKDATSLQVLGEEGSLLSFRPRRPVCETLYDCFVAIRDDEWEHVKTMVHMQQDDQPIPHQPPNRNQ